MSSCILAYAGQRRMYGAKWFAFAVGVGHDEDAIAMVRLISTASSTLLLFLLIFLHNL